MRLLTRSLRSVGSKGVIGWPQAGWPPPAGYLPRTAGVTLTNDSVLGTAAAWASVTLIARAMARLPLFTYRADGKAKKVDKAHPLYQLLHNQPNPSMTSFTWRSTSVGHIEGWGNSYSEIERNRNEQIIGLHPRRPERWRIEWKAGRKVFFYQQPDTGREVELEAERVFHVPAFSSDGIVGYSPISLHRRSFALSLAAIEYGTRVFENDARPSVLLMHPKTFSDKAVENLQSAWVTDHTGPENAGKVGLLEEGVRALEFGFPPEDAQYLDTRKFQRDETDDIFGIPVGFRSSAEEGMAIKFVVYTLGSRLVMLEQEIKRQLLPEDDVFAEHAVEGLLRGNTTARASWYAAGRTNGWFNVDEIRAFENLEPLPDRAGETYLQPLNMQPAGGSEGSPDRNPSPTTGNPLSPGAVRPLEDTEPLEATQPSRNGRTEVPVR